MADEASESLAAARMIDARCDAFQQALAAGQSVAIESFLADVPPPQRQKLLEELLGLDVDFRVARGERPVAGDYTLRFPELPGEQIAALFNAAQASGDATPTQNAAAPATEQATILSPSDAVATPNEATAAILPTLRYFGDYEVLSEIARGGMGVVFKARQQSLNRLVAIKMILGGRLASSEEVTRFRREAEAAAQLEHPSIVPIYEIGTHGDQHYFSMGYVDGPSLSARLADQPLEPREAAMLIRDVALAVHYAHERGVVHRDLKPSNILLATRSDGQPGELPYAPRVTDFGLAKLSRSDQSLTEAGQILGTPSYMPPEQAAGQVHQVGPSADIYSLGAVLYACLTGRPPFQAASAIDTVRQVLERDPVSLRDLNQSIPRDLETISLKCLEKQISRRYPSAKDVAEELQRFLDGHPISARPVSRRERSWRWCRRNPVVAGLIFAVACSLLLGIAVSSYFAWKEGQRAIAESSARTDEERQRLEAQRQTKIANLLSGENLKLAEQEKTAREKAELNAENALRQTRLAKRNLYAANMSLIQVAWDSARVTEVLRLLNLCRPQPGQAGGVDDPRGFEWFYWDRLCRSGPVTIKWYSWPIFSIAFSPDGKQLAFATGMKVKVCDAATGQEVVSIRNQVNTVSSVAFSPNGKLLATTCLAESVVRIWDAASGREVRALKGHTDNVWKVTFSSDGQRLASASSKEIKVWSAMTGLELLNLDGWRSVTLSADGKWLAAAGRGSFIEVWDAKDGTRRVTTEYDHKESSLEQLNDIALSPDGQLLAAGGGNKTVGVYDTNSGQKIQTLRGHMDEIHAVAFSPDGDSIASASGDQTLKIWNAQTGQERMTLKGHTGDVKCLAFSPDGKKLASGSEDLTIKVWDARSHQEAITFRNLGIREGSYSGGLGSAIFSTDEKQIASAGDYRIVTIRDAETGTETLRLKGHTKDVNRMVYSSDGKFLATASNDGTAKVWDATSGQEKVTLTGHANRVNSVSFSKDGKRLVTSGGDETVKLWDAASGTELLTFRGHKGNYVHDAAWSPDGTRVISSAGSHTVPPTPGQLKLWDAASGQEILSLRGHTDRVYGVIFSPDGTRIASTSADWTVRMWNAASGEELFALWGHTAEVHCVTFSPDGTRIASAGYDKTIKIWEATTGQEMITLKGHAYGISSVAFSKDGRRLVSTGGDGDTKIWDARPLEDEESKLKDAPIPPGSKLFQDLKSFDYQQAFKQAESRRMRPARLSMSVGHGTILYSGMFIPNKPPDLKWSSRHGMNTQAFDQTHAELVAGGYQLEYHTWLTLDGQKLHTTVWIMK